MWPGTFEDRPSFMAAMSGNLDTVRGEIVKAFIVLRHPQETDVAKVTLTLQELVRAHLGAYEYISNDKRSGATKF